MKPTVGRIVHFTPQKKDGVHQTPRAAIITYVHSPELVNLDVFGQDGNDQAAGIQTSVQLKAAHNTVGGHYWEWPPRV